MLQKLKQRKNDQKGFTIIEVLIVLAIAGLIMLIIFLAVPALQRSARNTQRKNDAAAIGSAVANYIDNNGGAVPVAVGLDVDPNTVDVCSGPGGVTAPVAAPCGKNAAGNGNLETAKLGYYTEAEISLEANKASDVETKNNAVMIDTGYGCNTANTGASATANGRTVAILYATETSSAGVAQQCLEQ